MEEKLYSKTGKDWSEVSSSTTYVVLVFQGRCFSFSFFMASHTHPHTLLLALMTLERMRNVNNFGSMIDWWDQLFPKVHALEVTLLYFFYCDVEQSGWCWWLQHASLTRSFWWSARMDVIWLAQAWWLQPRQALFLFGDTCARVLIHTHTSCLCWHEQAIDELY